MKYPHYVVDLRELALKKKAKVPPSDEDLDDFLNGDGCDPNKREYRVRWKPSIGVPPLSERLKAVEITLEDAATRLGLKVQRTTLPGSRTDDEYRCYTILDA